MLFGKRWNVAVGQNLDQRDFEWRQRKSAIQAVSALLPLAGDARMTVEKGRDQIGFVAIDIAGFPPAHKIAQQRFGYFRIGLWRKSLAQHRRCDRHVEQVKPAIHARKSVGQFMLRMAQGIIVEAAWNRNFSSKSVPQKLLVEALDCRQNG